MNRVGVLAIDADGLDWGKGHEDLGVYMRALAGLGPNGALANARFELLALQLTDRALPIVVPQGAQHCWLTSLAVTYGKALRDEIDRDQRGLLAWLYRGASWMAEGVLRLTRADHVVYVNHLLFSTSLYGAWTAEDLAPALAALRRAFPKRAIVWRSLNAEDNAGLLAAMDGQGARRVVSRMVWTLADPARQWAPRTDAKADRKLVAAGGLSVEAPTDLSPENLARVIQLYEDVYLAKYSRANPAYRSDMLLAAIESGVLNLQLVRGPEGDIQAFAADHVYERMLSSPMLGHDRDRPASAGLYRVAMSLSVLRALEAGLSVNYSAGAGAFKRHRGAKPALEYMAVFDGHLPAWRRIGYGLLARVLKAMTPFPAGLSAAWAPVALSRQLRAKPLARQVADVPIVLFRGPSGVTALEDRCPHRNYPLSDGEVENGVLRCPYHGWRFDGAGACVEVPGADPAQPLEKLGARRLAVVERHGAIFVRLDGDAPLDLPPLVGDPDHDHFWWTRAPWRGRALDALENILDPFHTNFIHDGLIRMSRRRQPVRQTLTFRPDGFEVAYDQDSPDVGWMSRLLEGERQRSVGRYFPPITFQGRWEGPKGLTLCATAFFVPETKERYRAFGCWTTPKGRAPAWLKRQAILMFVRPVSEQDRVALDKQHATITAFGGPRFKSGPTDRIATPLTQLYQGEALTPRIDGPHTIWL